MLCYMRFSKTSFDIGYFVCHIARYLFVNDSFKNLWGLDLLAISFLSETDLISYTKKSLRKVKILEGRHYPEKNK